MPTARICEFCKSDCSAVPHVRDRKGRFACRACLAKRKPKAHRGADAPPVIEPSAAPASAAVTAGDADLIPLAEPDPSDASAQACPVCLLRIPPDLGRCARCGYDPAKGVQSSRLVAKTRAAGGPATVVCPHCGYDMTGVPGLRCPECGKTARVDKRARYDKQEAARVRRWAYLKPLMMIAVGLTASLLIRGMGSGSDAIVHYLASLIVFVPIGFIAYFVCCTIWIGFDAHLHRVALDLTAVFVVVDLVSIAAGFIPILFLPALITLIAFVALLSEMLDLELTDALYVAIVFFVLKIALAFTLVAYFL